MLDEKLEIIDSDNIPTSHYADIKQLIFKFSFKRLFAMTVSVTTTLYKKYIDCNNKSAVTKTERHPV